MEGTHPHPNSLHAGYCRQLTDKQLTLAHLPLYTLEQPLHKSKATCKYIFVRFLPVHVLQGRRKMSLSGGAEIKLKLLKFS